MAFMKPSATEAFNLRTKCAELGEKINSEYDKTANYGLAVMKQPLLPLVQEHRSHYNPKTNHCYVELWVKTNLLILTAPKDSRGYITRADFLKRYDLGYMERTLYDGQTGEELASAQNGVKTHAPIGLLKGELAGWSEAYSKIDEVIGDQ